MADLERRRAGTPRAAWLSGLILGALAGFALFVFPPIGIVVVVVAGALMRWAGRALLGVGGLLAGIGGMWVAVFGRVKLSCAAEAGCEAQSIDAVLVVAVAMLATGVAVLIVAERRARRH